MKIWDGDDIKAVLRVLNGYTKGEMSWINYLSFHFKKLEKRSKEIESNTRKDIIKMRAEINGSENTKSVDYSSKGKCWFFKKNIDKFLVR